MNAKMSHRDNMRRDIKSEAQGNLSAAQEGVLKTAVVANALFHEQNEMQIREEQSRVGSFEEAFQKIKEATGVSDVNQAGPGVRPRPCKLIPGSPRLVSALEIKIRWTAFKRCFQYQPVRAPTTG